MPNILVVDDTPLDRQLVQGILKKGRDVHVESAGSGVEALARLGSDGEAIDIVVTDLNMPEMDGLELVTAMQLQHPHIPVVLITAHGSEDLAVDALAQGAASYVPKLQMGGKLVDTVQQVLAFAQSENSYERLARCMTDVDFRFCLENDAAIGDSLVELVQQIAGSMGLCEGGQRTRLGLAIEEALQIAIYRGNLELTPEEFRSFEMHQTDGLALVEERLMSPPYRDRRLYVTVRLSPREAQISIRDEGPSPHFASSNGEGDPREALREVSSRGLVLMQSFMDEVSFGPSGNEVVMVKRGKPAPLPVESSRGA
ncbi:MAG: response regulator [Pirellulaceae bacterium]